MHGGDAPRPCIIEQTQAVQREDILVGGLRDALDQKLR